MVTGLAKSYRENCGGRKCRFVCRWKLKVKVRLVDNDRDSSRQVQL